jgi:hypothetical protein
MRRVIAMVLLVGLFASSCMSAPRNVSSPRTYIPIKRPERIWLVDSEGERLEVNKPRILPGDTLFGRSRLGEEVWIALDDVRRVQARELDTRKTMLAVGGAALAAGILVAIAAGGGSGVDRDVIDRPEQSIIFFRSR